jgi:hypothetical protein
MSNLFEKVIDWDVVNNLSDEEVSIVLEALKGIK